MAIFAGNVSGAGQGGRVTAPSPQPISSSGCADAAWLSGREPVRVSSLLV